MITFRLIFWAVMFSCMAMFFHTTFFDQAALFAFFEVIALQEREKHFWKRTASILEKGLNSVNAKRKS